MTSALKNADLSMTIDQYTEDEDTDFDKMLQSCGVCDDCGDLDSGYCYCTSLDFDTQHANNEERKILQSYREENVKLSLARDHRCKIRKARKLLSQVRKHVMCRNVAFYWVGQAVKRSCAEDGEARNADKAAYVADCASEAPFLGD